jgi:hypothetical protein
MGADIQSWCESVAGLGVDMLVDSGLIRKEDYTKATAIVAEEILVRLAMGDYPPSVEKLVT